jgi:hypothetical protein
MRMAKEPDKSSRLREYTEQISAHGRRNRPKNSIFHVTKREAEWYERKIPSPDSRRTFPGAAIDSGAQRSVIGLPQAKALARFQAVRWQLEPSRAAFRFG